MGKQFWLLPGEAAPCEELSRRRAHACRRGEDRNRCVVDSFGASHEIKNLFVVDGSSLPGSVSVDPSLTIMAFSSQSAEHLNRNVLG